jgi:transcriptional regulator NrdR family protein
MSCPKCGHLKSIVVESRVFEGQHVRKRECIKCGHSFKTIETPYEGSMYYPRKPKPKKKEITLDNINTDVFRVWK